MRNSTTMMRRPSASFEMEDALAAAGTSLRNGLVFVGMLFALGLLIFLVRQGSRQVPPLSDHQIEQLLHDEKNPSALRQALAAVEVRMEQGKAVRQFYADLLRLTRSDNEDVRHRVADMLGKDPSRQEFQEALRRMLYEPSLLVRNAAALSLAEFDDRAGREHILAMLHPAVVIAPHAGRLTTVTEAGAEVQHGSTVAKISHDGVILEVRAPITGSVKMEVEEGDVVSGGVRLGSIQPAADQLLAALRALQRIGSAQDVRFIHALTSQSSGLPPQVLEQAQATERAIAGR